MEISYFTHNEAHKKIGQNIEALYDFPSVPAGSKGKVIKVRSFNDKNWTVRVKWNMQRKSTLILS